MTSRQCYQLCRKSASADPQDLHKTKSSFRRLFSSFGVVLRCRVVTLVGVKLCEQHPCLNTIQIALLSVGREQCTLGSLSGFNGLPWALFNNCWKQWKDSHGLIVPGSWPYLYRKHQADRICQDQQDLSTVRSMLGRLWQCNQGGTSVTAKEADISQRSAWLGVLKPPPQITRILTNGLLPKCIYREGFPGIAVSVRDVFFPHACTWLEICCSVNLA